MKAHGRVEILTMKAQGRVGILTVNVCGRVGILTVKVRGRVGILTDNLFLHYNSLGLRALRIQIDTCIRHILCN